MLESLNELGVPAQIMPQADTYLAIKTGVLDASMHSADGIAALTLNEVADYVVRAWPYPGYLMYVIVSNQALDALPADLRDTVIRTSVQWSRSMYDTYILDESVDAEKVAILEERGMTVLPDFPPEEVAKIHEVASRLWLEMAQELGDEAVGYVDELVSALTR